MSTYMVSPEAYARRQGVKIGKNCFISTRGFSSEPYLITIGNGVQLTHGVMIHTHGGGNAVRHQIPDFDVFGPVVVDDGAYVGVYSQIMPGVRIGKNAIVAAGSVVTKSVPDNMVVGGNPARIICSIDDYLSRNMRFNAHTYGMSADEKKRVVLSLPQEKFIQKPDLII